MSQSSGVPEGQAAPCSPAGCNNAGYGNAGNSYAGYSNVGYNYAGYSYVPPDAAELVRQKNCVKDMHCRFSIVVPVYRTPEAYLMDMITSVIEQSYYRWELILADATEDDSVKQVVSVLMQKLDKRTGAERLGTGVIRYLPLPRNEGIAENTNHAIGYATGDYIGLLDHDDVLTPDALYEMAAQIEAGKEKGQAPLLLYSDEDKCNGDRTEYYEPHIKEKFNLDLLLSNNYVCHFMVLERKLMQELMLRGEYNGAQDYDLALRAVERLNHDERLITHVPRVLYHWRCHEASTAENPRSKEYAYAAGRRALLDCADRNGIRAAAVNMPYMGFYKLVYHSRSETDRKGSLAGMLEERKDLGAVGGSIIRKGKIAGGRMDAQGKVFYEGLPKYYSGYFHRAQLTQDADAVDIRCMVLREELRSLFEEITGVPYRAKDDTGRFAPESLAEGTDYRELSLRLCGAIREKGYRIAYLPDFRVLDDMR